MTHPYRDTPSRRYVVGKTLDMPEWYPPDFKMILVPYKILSAEEKHPWWGRLCVRLRLLSPTGRETEAIVDGPNSFVGMGP